MPHKPWGSAPQKPSSGQIGPLRLQHPSLVASLGIGLAFLLLIGLGVWQIERLHWKERLLARIAAAAKAPPVELTTTTPPLFTRVQVKGVFSGKQAALLGADVRGGHMGAQELEVLERPDGKPILVDLGWIPTDGPPVAPVAGPMTITGYVRLPEHSNWLSAADDLADRHFYTLNPITIGASLGGADVAPFTLVALGKPAWPGAPSPAQTLPEPVNNHLQYAITWFTLAAALVVMVGVKMVQAEK